MKLLCGPLAKTPAPRCKSEGHEPDWVCLRDGSLFVISKSREPGPGANHYQRVGRLGTAVKIARSPRDCLTVIGAPASPFSALTNAPR